MDGESRCQDSETQNSGQSATGSVRNARFLEMALAGACSMHNKSIALRVVFPYLHGWVCFECVVMKKKQKKLEGQGGATAILMVTHRSQSTR